MDEKVFERRLANRNRFDVDALAGYFREKRTHMIAVDFNQRFSFMGLDARFGRKAKAIHRRERLARAKTNAPAPNALRKLLRCSFGLNFPFVEKENTTAHLFDLRHVVGGDKNS